MNSAELRTILQIIGISGLEFADLIEVNPRTVRRWLSEQTPPEFAQEKAQAYLDTFIDTQDGWVKAELVYRDPNNKLWTSNDQHDQDKITDVFPRKYWYKGREQHEVFC